MNLTLLQVWRLTMMRVGFPTSVALGHYCLGHRLEPLTLWKRQHHSWLSLFNPPWCSIIFSWNSTQSHHQRPWSPMAETTLTTSRESIRYNNNRSYYWLTWAIKPIGYIRKWPTHLGKRRVWHSTSLPWVLVSLCLSSWWIYFDSYWIFLTRVYLAYFFLCFPSW